MYSTPTAVPIVLKHPLMSIKEALVGFIRSLSSSFVLSLSPSFFLLSYSFSPPPPRPLYTFYIRERCGFFFFVHFASLCSWSFALLFFMEKREKDTLGFLFSGNLSHFTERVDIQLVMKCERRRYVEYLMRGNGKVIMIRNSEICPMFPCQLFKELIWAYLNK